MTNSEYKGKKRSGSLFRRQGGKRYDIGDPLAKDATIYLRYKVDGKTFTKSMQSSDLTAAERKRDAIMAPLRVADKQEAIRQQQVRLNEADEEAKQLAEQNAVHLTFEDAWDTYINSAKGPDCGQETLNRYKSHLNALKSGWIKNTQRSSD